MDINSLGKDHRSIYIAKWKSVIFFFPIDCGELLKGFK